MPDASLKSCTRAVLAGAAVVAMTAPAAAHHGTSAYDRTKPVTVTGTVTEFRFANPHPQLFVDVKDDSGKVTNWGCEVVANPYQLLLSGWTRQRSTEALKSGTVVTVTLAPSKAGTPAGLLLKLVNERDEQLLLPGDTQ